MMNSSYENGKSVVKHLQQAGHIAYFAGGFVRDFLMKRPSDDIDIATDASVEQIQKLFPKTIPVGVAFGIVIVVFEGEHFEVATFRKDRGYTDGRRPTGIDPATPQEDAHRRDFTINGMFYDPIEEILYDHVGGQQDIKLKVLRAIGNADERFFEDRLRMMRAIRYATRFAFEIESKTLGAIRAHSRDLLPAVAMERIWQEFKKMSHFAHFDQALILMHDVGLLSTIFPTLKELPIKEITRRVSAIEKFPKEAPTIAQLLELFPAYDLEQIYALCDTLKLSNQEKAFARHYHHAKTLFSMPQQWQNKLEPYEWARFYANPYSGSSLNILAAKQHHPETFLDEHQKRMQTLEPWIVRLQQNQPIVRAKHLIDLGIAPGVRMGELLEEAERLCVNKNLKDPSTALELLKGSPLWKG
jgi:poly(A) polymerase